MSHIRKIFQKEPVLVIAAIAAALSMVPVPPSPAYMGYIDLRVLCLLLCLMAVVAGLQGCGAFQWLTFQLLRRIQNGRLLSVTLVMLPFFSSMLVTNDVALITFVPFAVLVLTTLGRQEQIIWVVVAQTVAANLGSMATPVGNPQNLFLYNYFALSAGEFFSLVLPLTAVSLVGVVLLMLKVPGEVLEVRFGEQKKLEKPGLLALYGLLFALCLLSVFRVVHYGLLTVVVVIAVALADRKVLGKVDYGLLLTFVCFFIFAGNMGQVAAVRDTLTALMEKSTLLSSALASQVISNVPAAVLLSGFTGDWRGLLAGVNIGGLGTIIASLASLISFKAYAALPGARVGKYMGVFTVVNFAGLAALLALGALLV